MDDGATDVLPVDQEFNLKRLRVMVVPSETATGVPGATISAAGATPFVAPTIVYVTPISAPLHCAVNVTFDELIV